MKKFAVLLFILISLMCHAQYDVSITGEDTLCIGQTSQYSVEVESSSNQYLFRDTARTIPGGNGNFALGLNYDVEDITNTFSYDLWVKPTRTINMSGESNVCPGGVSVPLANSNQNWALVPNALGSGRMGVGLTIGTNGLMVGEHSSNILVSRLSYSVSITDWVHVAIVYRPDSIFLFLDGDLVRSRPTHCPANMKCITGGLTGYYYSPDFRGNVDEFRLWDIPLTREQVVEIKDKKIINQVDGLRYYASFDDGKFERKLGDIGTVNMTFQELSAENNIKKSSWELSAYTGPDIANLTAFMPDDFNYLWSTGETTQNIYYSPVDTINHLYVEAYNDHYSLVDTMEIIGANCCQEIYYDTITQIVYDTISICTDVPDEDLVSYYPFDGNAIDYGTMKKDGIVNGAVLTSDRNGIADQAYQFDGVDDYISIPDSLAITDDFTISFWAFSESESGPVNILCDGSASDGGRDFLINFRGNEIGIRADKSGGSLNHEYTSPASLTGLGLVNQWVHVAWVMKPGYSKVYLDGLEIAHIAETGSNVGSHDPFSYIGARNVWGSPDNFYKGKLDDLKIYAKGLEPDQIMSLYNGSAMTKTHYDTITEIIYDTITQTRRDLQYLRFESYYSEDAGQVNVYEIQAYDEGTNIALNKPTFTSSCEGGGIACGGPAVDGDGFSRWSSDRDDAGPDSVNPHFIVVDLGQEYYLDSIILNIEGFDHWNQTFGFYGSPDSVDWFLIGEGEEITGILTYDSYTSDRVHDTIMVEVYDTIYEFTPAFQYPVYREGEIKYVKFESFYSEDRNQVNVYEIQAFYEGTNVARNKPSFANSTPQGSYSAVDGNDNSRWSANRYDVGPDYANPHFIVVDLQDAYLLDSIYLNIEGFDGWNQTFNILVSNDSSRWYLIDSEVNTTGIFTYPLRTWNIVTVHDTITTTIENRVSVTDTLIIDALLTGIAGPDNINTLKVYPNPARDYLYINTGDYARMNGYKLKIMNQLGAVVFETNVEDPLYQVNLSTWSGKGLYFIQLIDSGDMIIDIRKIILQ
jgi:hypothetical protein